ncbi:MAG: gluconate 2-dehydrogenase subunit 3 family protein [Gammaproteobacteria bacterium]|nr:gluconate 2-dehydrogenase subunit 3 family protein [Gammaproteobacteria bacterium]
MIDTQLSRRAFLRSASAAAKNSIILLGLPAILVSCERSKQAVLNNEEFSVLSEEEAQELHAVAARIIPTDETPGATEAGVIYFIDNVLNDDREAEHETLRIGLREIQVAAAQKFNVSYFHELEFEQQDQLLTEFENTEFFGTIRFLTIAGMFSLPEYGGNRDKIGYELIGFEDRHAWQPPYGFYDADYAQRGE